MAAVTICSDFGAQENKVCHVSIVSPSICHEVMELDALTLVFWMLNFKSIFSPFTFIKRLFSSSSLSTIRVLSSAYLRLFLFLPAILILLFICPHGNDSPPFNSMTCWSGKYIMYLERPYSIPEGIQMNLNLNFVSVVLWSQDTVKKIIVTITIAKFRLIEHFSLW